MDPVITLLTDFGLADGYVAAMKGVILTGCPTAKIIDISHEIPPQDVACGAFVLCAAAFRFPPGTIHVGVVDPGVGGARKGMILLSGGHVFVGPDNGLFTFALGEGARAFSISPPEGASATFHGRDLFAPAAAKIASGTRPADLGEPMVHPVVLPQWEKRDEPDRVVGRFIHIDRFGNAVTNLRPEDFPEGPGGFAVPDGKAPEGIPIERTYGAVPSGRPLWLVGSEGFFELALRDGNAASAFDLERGQKVLAEKKGEGA